MPRFEVTTLFRLQADDESAADELAFELLMAAGAEDILIDDVREVTT